MNNMKLVRSESIVYELEGSVKDAIEFLVHAEDKARKEGVTLLIEWDIKDYDDEYTLYLRSYISKTEKEIQEDNSKREARRVALEAHEKRMLAVLKNKYERPEGK